MEKARRAIFIRVLLVVCTAAALLPLAASSAGACSCVAATPEQYARWADVVFTGVVEDVTETGMERAARFEARVVYKGRIRRHPTVRTAADEAACGVRFNQGTKYTVFAERTDQGLWTGLCSGNKRGKIRHARYDLPPGRRF